MIFKISPPLLQQDANKDLSKKEDSKDASKLILFKTKFDRRFQQINISDIIRSEIRNTIDKTKDSDLKEFLQNITPLLCFLKNDNLSNHLVRANVSHYL